MNKTSRIDYLDVLKGFTILLVIIGHIADGYLHANIFEEKNYYLKQLYSFLYSFHMSLFL